MEKKKDTMIKDAIILCLITLVLGAVLAGVYAITKDPIEQAQAKTNNEACAKVVASGDSVQDIMLKYGALAVLSLDGLMAVELNQPTALATGDSVNLTFSDGKAVTGRVESNLDSRLVITVSPISTVHCN